MPICIDFLITSVNDGYISPFTGGYVRGFFLNAVYGVSQDLANKLHDKKGIKPYSIKPLRPIGKKMNVVKGGWKIEKKDEMTFSISFLQDGLEAIILDALLNTEKITFSNIKFNLEKITVKRESYKDLASKVLGPRIGLEFKTPTFFKDPKLRFPYLFPEPKKIVSNLIKIWNAFAPPELRMPSEKVIEWSETAIETRSFELKTREAIIENVRIPGFKGRVEWIIIEGERGILTYLSPLLLLSEFSNVGQKRTYGLGVVKITDLTAINK